MYMKRSTVNDGEDNASYRKRALSPEEEGLRALRAYRTAAELGERETINEYTLHRGGIIANLNRLPPGEQAEALDTIRTIDKIISDMRESSRFTPKPKETE
jgi:hypothetical protein